MHFFLYKDGLLHCEDISVNEIAHAVGTPFYLYSYRTLVRHYQAFDSAFSELPHLVCYSVKANSNLALLKTFINLGGGVDVVSGGELFRALRAGTDPSKIVYSGVGKRAEEIRYALQENILMLNVESYQELHLINSTVRKLGIKAPISLRVNPDIDPQTHPYIATGIKQAKFGVDINLALAWYREAEQQTHLAIKGVSCHIGSQLIEVGPFVEALRRVKELVLKLKEQGIEVQYVDLGGGLGITYDREEPPHPKEYAEAVKKELDTKDLTLILEPGRVIMGNAGILVTKVLYTKSAQGKTFIVVDAAMNDLIRPSLYGSFHAIQPVKILGRKTIKADIVGPICESSDFFAKERDVEPFEPGELMAIMSSGAYGFSMSSNYNSRPRVAEVLVKENQHYIIRKAETYEDLIRGEVIPEFLN